VVSSHEVRSHEKGTLTVNKLYTVKKNDISTRHFLTDEQVTELLRQGYLVIEI